MKHEMILAKKAIKAAMSQDWAVAVELNLEILKTDPEDISALNRLANAYIELRNPKEAKKVIRKVLRLDRDQPVALKNLKRLSTPSHQEEPPEIVEGFIKEPGKTRIIEVEALLSPSALAHLKPSEQLNFKIKRRQLLIEDAGGHEIAKLNKELGQPFKEFLRKKIEFKLTLTAIKDKRLTIHIKSPEPLFPPEKEPKYRPFAERSREEPPLDPEAGEE